LAIHLAVPHDVGASLLLGRLLAMAGATQRPQVLSVQAARIGEALERHVVIDLRRAPLAVARG